LAPPWAILASVPPAPVPDFFLVARSPLWRGYRPPFRSRLTHPLISMSFAPFRLLFTSTAFVAFASVVAAAEPWTLDRAVAYALEHSPDARVARARVDGAQALVQQAQSAWYPQLAVSGRYTDTNNPMMAFGSILDQRAFNSGLDFNHPGQIDNLDAAGTVAYNLYSGGKASASRQASRREAKPPITILTRRATNSPPRW